MYGPTVICVTQKQEDWTHADGLDGEVAEGTQGHVAAEGEPEGSLVGWSSG